MARETQSTTVPRTVWSYCEARPLSPFRQRCLDTWEHQNPEWQVIMLDEGSVWEHLEEADLPRKFERLAPAWKRDAVCLALLAKHGGVWTDSGVACLKPVSQWLLEDRGTATADGVDAGIAAEGDLVVFCSDAWAAGGNKVSIERWFFSAPPRHPVVLGWRQIFIAYWDSIWPDSTDPIYLPDHAHFRHLDLAHLRRFGCDRRIRTAMHACLAKLLEDVAMREIWTSRVRSLPADQLACWHLAEPEVQWSTFYGPEKWLRTADRTWVAHVLTSCRVLRFPRDFAVILDGLPVEVFDSYTNCLTAVFQAIFVGFEHVD
mmetsp:Transcript_49045/g.110286  ORF Transcript_49045/g.110286 Transcript_49045/m.110286 type:complete len:317 (-) Transcript_49045:52-1002(-)